MTIRDGREADLVSVIISAFNSEAYLAEAIESVLQQDWEPLELIVSDDGSSDSTLTVAGRFGSRLRIVEGSDEGLAATRNRGMAAAQGAYFLHLDADDLLLPGALHRLMAVFQQERLCGIAAGKFTSFVSPELPGNVASRFATSTEPQRGHLSGVAIIRAEVFARVGPLNDKYRPASDMQWWLRAREHAVDIQLIDDLVLYRRVHGNNSSLRDSESHRQAALGIARDALKRKRGGTAD